MDNNQLKMAIIGGVGSIFLALGVYGVFVKGEPFHPIFNNQDFINILSIIGGVLVFIEVRFFIKLAMNRAKEQSRNQ